MRASRDRIVASATVWKIALSRPTPTEPSGGR